MASKKKRAKKPAPKKKGKRKASAKKAPASPSSKPEPRHQVDMLNPVPDVSDETPVLAKQLAEFLDITDRRVRQLADEGIVVKAARDRYLLKASVQRYCRYLKNLREGDDSKKSEETKLTKVRAESQEFDLAVKRKEFYPAKEVDQALLHAATTLTTMQDGAAARIASTLGGGGALRRKLIDEFAEIRKQYAEALRRFSTSLQSDGWDRRATGGPRARRVGKAKKGTTARKR